MANVIDVHQVSKLYRLGAIGTGSFKQDLKFWWMAHVLKKQNTFFQLPDAQGPADFLWALQNVSFSVEEGEVLGIIGSNGSGKSTLLKIISRITSPTKGYVRGKGKVSSLLEVGTGFNPELTGRQNIYISGYILGMSKEEIKKKFDEIVDFSGIEKFLDTPVKRYSSGMYMRLAFSVAAHLEPDILIVDEVLAVGDADFQQKCLGKMKNVSRSQGRTILFVSHSLPAITGLCSKVMWLDKGIVKDVGKPSQIVESYSETFSQNAAPKVWLDMESAPGTDSIKLKKAEISAHQGNKAVITVNTPILFSFEFWSFLEEGDINVNVILHTGLGECVFNLGSHSVPVQKGILCLNSVIPAPLLNKNTYFVSLKFILNHSSVIHEFTNCAQFEVEDVREDMTYFGEWPGIIRPNIDSRLFMKSNQL